MTSAGVDRRAKPSTTCNMIYFIVLTASFVLTFMLQDEIPFVYGVAVGLERSSSGSIRESTDRVGKLLVNARIAHQKALGSKTSAHGQSW